MAEALAVQSRRSRVLVGFTFAVLAIALTAVSAVPLLGPVGTDVTNGDILLTARLAALFWCIGWPIALARSPDYTGLRVTWGIGALLLAVHVAVAFHLGHGWSHAHAWEHTRQVGGYGDGIFVNYAFVLVWLADAAWASVAFGSYTTRPRWLHRGVHGFLAFVVLNAAVVFGSWDVRVPFTALLLVVLAAAVFAKRLRPVDAPPAD